MTRRLLACVEAWPDCSTGGYDPKCCRFPKSCSATVYDESTPDADLEPAPRVRERLYPRTRLDEARERCMDALDAWYEQRAHGGAKPRELEYDLIDAYAALKRAQNGEPEDDLT